MNFLNFINYLVINCISLILPMTLYLVYIAYIKNLRKKESKHLFSIAIILSSILTLLTNESIELHTYAILSTPLIISYLTKRDLLALFLTSILLIYYKKVFAISGTIPIIEHFIYYLIYIILKDKKYFYKYFTVAFILFKFLFISIIAWNSYEIEFSLPSVFRLNITLMLLSLFSATAIYFFEKSKRILDINKVLKQLEKEQEVKASIFKLAHEVKNPLAVCSGYLEMLKDLDNEKEKINNYLNIISEEINRSLILLNDFSSLGKIKKLEKEEIDLSLLFEDVKNILNPLYLENNGSIIIPDTDELYIEADYNRLKQVLINVLKNSLESQNKSTLKVSIKIKKEKNLYHILLTDNGCGMTKNELNHIYDMFYTTKTNGTGIGVPYIKEVISMHGGEIDYKSQKNKGTTTIITLPI